MARQNKRFKFSKAEEHFENEKHVASISLVIPFAACGATSRLSSLRWFLPVTDDRSAFKNETK